MSVTGRSLLKGWFGRIRDGEIDGIFDFQYNPTTMKHEVSPQYSMVDPPGSPIPTAVFKSVSNDVMKVKLLLDATDKYSSEEQGIWAKQSFLESLARPDLSSYLEGVGQFVSPPQVMMGIGPRTWDVVVTGLRVDTIRWNRDLIPTRAWVTMSLMSVYVDFETVLGEYQTLLVNRELAEVS